MAKQEAVASPLETMECLRTSDPKVVGLRFKDRKGGAFAAVVNSSGMAFLIGKLFDQALQPAFAAASENADPRVPTCSTAASHLEWRPGRSATEVATTMKVGCLELVVHIPLAEVLRATTELRERVERKTGPTSAQ
ncbi:MAG: hypothetical protein H0W40_05105 [Methylibium sp.]|uniref:hypothetical protein n=1 Tax=Methylibium sp. TaxID=2067992 RepID=UPI00179F1EF3|nr:hypothetical protein [Methylibium sp.]MBA3596743.1 hypothetical protein [Methylibium sp.]